MATVADKLRRARDRIVRGWHQGYFAGTAHGDPVEVSSLAAVRWCAWGAIAAPDIDIDAWGHLRGQACNLMFDLVCKRHGVDLVKWNDAPGRTRDEVLELFDIAIVEAEASS